MCPARHRGLFPPTVLTYKTTDHLIASPNCLGELPGACLLLPRVSVSAAVHRRTVSLCPQLPPKLASLAQALVFKSSVANLRFIETYLPSFLSILQAGCTLP